MCFMTVLEFRAMAGVKTWIAEKSSLSAGYVSLFADKPGDRPVCPDVPENQ